MALLVCCADGNWTTAGTWAVGDNTSLLRAISNNTNSTTAYVESAAFTPGAITIDAILVRIAARNGTTGTMSVRLAQGGATVAGTEVTVNMTDIPACSASTQTTNPDEVGEGDWFLFKFAAPVLLVVATAYTVSMKTSTNAQVALYRDGTAANWSRILRTTTTQAPVAGDDLVIAGEWTAAATMTSRTVTMDETATTDYGSNTTTQATPALAIVKGGTLTWGTTAATNYKLRLSGWLIVYRNGTYNQGTSGTKIPRDSTAQYQVDCGTSGDFGIIGRNGSAINWYGLSRTVGIDVSWTRLAADLAAAGTSATTSVATGWKNGDVTAIASTVRPASGAGTTQAESVTLTGDASGTSLPSFAGVTNAHSGSSPTQAEIILLTRNNVMTLVTATKYAVAYFGSACIVNAQWTEFAGVGLTGGNKEGFLSVATNAAGGSVNLTHCSAHDNGGPGFRVTGGTSCVLNNCVTWNTARQGFMNITSSDAKSFVSCVSMKSGTIAAFEFDIITGLTVTDCVATSTLTNDGFYFGASGQFASFSGNVAHSNSGSGFYWPSAAYGTLTSCSSWYNGVSVGGGFRFDVNFSAGQNLNFVSCVAFGNNASNFVLSSRFWDNRLILDNFVSNSTTGNSTTTGLDLNNSTVNGGIFMYTCDFSTASGIKTAHTNDIALTTLLRTKEFLADNCKFVGTNIITNQTVLLDDLQQVGMTRLQQTDSTHRSYFKYGTVLTNSTTFQSSAPSQELQPNNASNKLKSGKIYAPCGDGTTKSISVAVRKSAAYNGNAPRLILGRQDSMGVTSDTVCDTLSVAADTWETLTYTTSAALENGAFIFWVDCDGTAGSVFVDDVVIV